MDDYKDAIIKAARRQEAEELGYKPPVFTRDAGGSLSISDAPEPTEIRPLGDILEDYTRRIRAEEARRAGPVFKLPDGVEVGANGDLTQPGVADLLQTRETTHGDYGKTAETAQALKLAMYNASRLPRADMRESIDLICTKMARIANGDPTEPDHWRDIAGYAQLVAERLERKA